MPKLATRTAGLRIEELCLVSSSFHHRPDFLGLDKRQPLPDVDVDAQFSLTKGLGPSVVGVTVRVQTKNDPSLVYHFHAELMALIRVDGPELTPELERRLLITGVNILFPFARENVANLTMRGRFGPMWIRPMNVQAALAAGPKGAKPLVRERRQVSPRRLKHSSSPQKKP